MCSSDLRYHYHGFIITEWIGHCKPSLTISKLFGGQMTRLFTVKCFVANYPISFISCGGLYATIALGYMLRIIEYEKEVEQVFTRDNSNGCHVIKTFSDSLWYVYVTFMTVGYGDYCPMTSLGRVIGVFTALLGTLMLSLLAVTIQKFYNLEPRELNVSDTLNILDCPVYR
jgi:hypothetical protein